MKITPLDIRQKTFEKQIRGYDKEEVTAFLAYLSQEWEKTLEEKRMLQLKFEQADKEAQQLREIEKSLFKTLKTAEDTGETIIEHANQTASEILRDAQMEADLITNEANSKAKTLLEAAESKSKGVLVDLSDEVEMLTETYKSLLEQRERLLGNLRDLAQSTLDAVRHSQEDFQEIDLSLATQRVYNLIEGNSSEELEEEEEPEMELILKPEMPDEERYYAVEDDTPATAETHEPDDSPVADAVGYEESEQTLPGDPEPKEEKKPEKQPGKNHGTGSFFDQFD